jgi:hypothetical protein
MNGIFLFTLCFNTRKNHLKTQTSTRHCSHGYGHGVQKLAMVSLMVMGKFFSYPALKMRDVGL